MKIVKLLRALFREAASALARTPLEVILGVIAWIALAAYIEDERRWDYWLRIIPTTLIALPLVFAASTLHETGSIGRTARWLISGVAIAAAAAYGFLIFDPALEAEGWRAATLVTASILALLSTPLLATSFGGDRRERTHRFTIRLAARTIGVELYVVALFLGLSAATAAVNGLFTLDLPGRVYAHIAALVFVLMPPWAVAAGLPALIAPPVPWGDQVLRNLRRLGLFLLAPLIALYLLIVYAHAIRIFVTGEVPSNLISPVILGAGALTLIATILLEPLYSSDERQGLTRFFRVIPVFLLPLCALALWAVMVRVGEHGWTEFRYLRTLAIVLLGVFSAAGILRLIRGERPPLASIPVVAGVALILAAVGPLSAPAVSFRSQTARLAAVIPPAAERSTKERLPIDHERYAEVYSRAMYLRSHFGGDALEPFLPADAAGPVERHSDLGAVLGVSLEPSDSLPRIINARLPESVGVEGVRGGTIYHVEYPHGFTPPGSPAPETRIDIAGTTITITPPDGPTLTADLAGAIEEMVITADTTAGVPVNHARTRFSEIALSQSTALHTLAGRDGQPRGQLILENINLHVSPGDTAVNHWRGMVVVEGSQQVESRN